MKIALIHHQLKHGGGMETYFVDLIDECARLKHEIHVFVCKASDDFGLPQGVHLHVFKNYLYPRFLRKFYFAWQLRRYFKNHPFDLKISTTRSFSQDIIITGGTHKGYLQKHHPFRISDHIEAFMEQKAYDSAQKVIAHSPLIEKDLLELYKLPRDKVIMHYPPVNSALFSFKPHEPHTPFRLLFASSSHRRKGGFLLLEALKLLPKKEFELWIAGRPFEKAHQLQQTVRELGYVKEMDTLFQQVDLLVLPSYYEPFGLVAAQALECGTPVLVSACSGVASLIGPDEGLILKTQSAQVLADLLLQAKSMPFRIQPDFIKRNHLELPEHVQALLNVMTIPTSVSM